MGLLIALTIIFIWFAHLFYTLNFGVVDFTNPTFYLHVLFQSYIYTGLFITAHDAMHGTVMRKKGVNKTIGTIASFFLCRDVVQSIN